MAHSPEIYKHTQEYKDWEKYHSNKRDEVKSLIEKCHNINQKCRFMFDASTVNAISAFCNQADELFHMKTGDALEASIKGRAWESAKKVRYEITKSNKSLYDSIVLVNLSMRPYLMISDITRQKPLSDFDPMPPVTEANEL